MNEALAFCNDAATIVNVPPVPDPWMSPEIRRLAKLWRTTIAETWTRCCHYTALRTASNDADTIAQRTAIRQAEAKVEMLKAK